MTPEPDILSKTVRDFIDAAGAKTPTPGGGSVAGVVGALGTALGQMVLNFSAGKKSLAQHEDYHAQLGGRLEKTCGAFEDLVLADIAAYAAYQQANRIDEGPAKTQAVAEATAKAIEVPRTATQTALGLLQDMKELVDKSNKWLVTDLLAAAALAVATITLSDYNVRINLPSMTDTAAADEIRKASADDLTKARNLHVEVEEATKEMLP